MGRVSIVKIQKDLKQSLHSVIDLLGGISSFAQAQDRVLLKPNLNDNESFTSPELTAALIELLFDHNINKLFIGESTFGNAKITNSYFKKTGYLELAKKYNIELINFNASRSASLRVHNPLSLQQIRIAEEVLKATKIINLPVMKVHYATGVTLCLKNLKGLLAKDEKRHFHEVALPKAIVDLNNTIKPDLNIVDCITCMQGMGPKGGELLSLNLLLAGVNSGEVDYVGSRIMGYTTNEVTHLKYYLQNNNIDIHTIRILGEKIEQVIHPFKKVNMNRIVPPFVTIYNKNACSSCVNALLLSFAFLDRELTDQLDIYLGSGHKQKADSHVKIGFGNCCIKNDVFPANIKGCPPYPFALKEIITAVK